MIRFTLLCCFMQLSSSVNSQKIIDYKPCLVPYFKIDPFTISSDSLLKSLLNDPDLRIDSLRLPSDTTLFYLRGYYKKFNPFTNGIKLVQVHLFQNLISLASKDTLLTYQLIGIADTGKNGRSDAIIAENNVYKVLKNCFFEINPYYIWKEKGGKIFLKGHRYSFGKYTAAMTFPDKWYSNKDYFCVSVRVEFSFIKNIDELLWGLKLKNVP